MQPPPANPSLLQICLTVIASLSLIACGPTSDFKATLAKAKTGDPQAQMDVGLMYLNGNSVTLNSAEGLNWIKQAAIKGHPAAQRTYGAMLRVAPPGMGTPEQAREWLEKAARQNDALAQMELASLHSSPNPPNDFVEALKWTLLAEKNGATNATSVRKLIEPQLSAAEQAQARARAETFGKDQ